jgi:hypothetical protein
MDPNLIGDFRGWLAREPRDRLLAQRFDPLAGGFDAGGLFFDCRRVLALFSHVAKAERLYLSSHLFISSQRIGKFMPAVAALALEPVNILSGFFHVAGKFRYCRFVLGDQSLEVGSHRVQLTLFEFRHLHGAVKGQRAATSRQQQSQQ